MKEELMFDGITEIREDIIERAEAYVFSGETEKKETMNVGGKKSRRTIPLRVTFSVIAASLLVVFACPLLYFVTQRSGLGKPPEAVAPGQSVKGKDSFEIGSDEATKELMIATDYVWIYYIEDEEICKEQHYVKLQPTDVFAVWKEKNGIGAEVQLLDCEILSNATTEELGDVVVHTVGDYFALYLTVSKNLEEYYEVMNEVLLLDSLEQTMTGYSGMEYQEYHLILK